MPIQVIRAIRTDALARALAATLAETTTDPFRPDLVVVPTRGIEGYLTQVVAATNGIAANIDFPSPREFMDLLHPAQHDDPWAPQRLVWPLLDAIDANLGERWCEPIRNHLRATAEWDRRNRRLSLASRLARLFTSYADERPAMIRDWQVSDHPPPDLPADVCWQFHLWRATHAEIGQGPLDRLPDPSHLPDRIAVFGPTRLPERLFGVLQTLAEDRTIDLYLPVASPDLWDALGWHPATDRAHESSRDLAVHPILRSMGRDTRELRLLLAAHPVHPAPAVGDNGTTLLSRLQQQIAQNSPTKLGGLAPDDSLQIHACHGSLRQVEVLREVILALLHEHPHLQPRDILIMVPDLTRYAPLLSAVFGDPDPRIAALRLAIADRTKEQRNEVLAALDLLLGLLPSRMTRSGVLDLLTRRPVRGRFGLREDDTSRIEELAGSAGIKWGLDEAHRAEYELAGIDQGTWQWGLRRMSLGTAMSDEGLAVFGDTLPLPDVGGNDIGPLGRLAEFLTHLGRLREAARTPRTVAEWSGLLSDAVVQLTDTGFTDTWQTEHALGVIETFAADAGRYSDTVELSLADIRHALADVLAGRPTRSGFRLGGMTACRMEPMRSVPYKLICLLGMDDGAFPRRSGRDGDNVLLLEPRIGERDPRSEDRQLFLDAIMAATEHLIITYTGRDERTNDERHPAVPLAELIDILPTDTSPVHKHRLQPFDEEYFDPARPFSHDATALAGAIAGRHRQPWTFLDAPLEPPHPMPERSLDSLAKFLKLPPSTFIERRLRVQAFTGDSGDDDALPFNLGPLDGYSIGDRLLQPQLGGADAGAVARAEARSGIVPPGALGMHELDEASGTAARILQYSLDFRAGHAPRAVSFTLDLADGHRLTATVPGVFGNAIVRATYANVKVKEGLGLWPYLLALQAAFPDEQWSAKISAKGGTIELCAPDQARSLAVLAQLFALESAGMCSPTPLTAASAVAYAQARIADPAPAGIAAARTAAVKAWGSDFDRRKDAMTIAYGHEPPFDRVWAQEPLPAERHPDEPTRFAAVARLIFDPLLSVNPGAGISTWADA